MLKAIFEGLAGVVGLIGAVVAVADFFGVREAVSHLAAAHIDIFVIGTISYIGVRWIFVDVANYNRKKAFSNRRDNARRGAGGKPRGTRK